MDNGEHKKFAHLSNRPNVFLLYGGFIIILMHLETSVCIMNAKACVTTVLDKKNGHFDFTDLNSANS